MTRSIVTFAALAASGPLHAADGPADPLPIKRVVLYKHGVGYFERRGAVEGTKTISLRFKQDQMSDVLKSLTVLDLGGGEVTRVAYDSQKPAEQLLSEFAFDLRAGDVRKALFEQLRGAVIEAEVAGRGTITGAILGTEVQAETRDGVRIERVSVSLLSQEDGEIVSADLKDLRKFRFTDEKLAADVKRYLELLRGTHRRDEKTVDLVCEGEGARQVLAAYTVEQPVWKATYRLVLFEREQEPFLQGWAVVDNPSEEDWNDVELSLVAGMPVSFRQDLYTPRFRERPWLVVEEDASVSFQGLQDMGVVAESRRKSVPPPPSQPVAGNKVAETARAFLTGFAAGAEAPAEAAADFKSVGEALVEQTADTVSREIGDLLEYRIDHAVTIPRHRSALIPIVSGRVGGGKVALYNEAARASNPMSAVALVNTTGVTLEGGPLTVLEGDTYAGESLIDTLKPDEKRYVPYAVELGIKATTKYGTESARVHRVVVANGVMWSYYRDTSRKTYAFDNRNDEARTVVVEHPRRNGYELLSPEPLEEELDRYRFELSLGARSRGELVVEEATQRESAWQISNVDADTLAIYQREGRLNAELEAFLRDIVRRKSEISALESERQAVDREMNAIALDQDRVRRNLSALGDTAEEKNLRAEYVEQLKDDEKRVQQLKSRRAELEREIESKRNAMNQAIREAAFEFDL